MPRKANNLSLLTFDALPTQIKASRRSGLLIFLYEAYQDIQEHHIPTSLPGAPFLL
jgi:hypothetical protein